MPRIWGGGVFIPFLEYFLLGLPLGYTFVGLFETSLSSYLPPIIAK